MDYSISIGIEKYQYLDDTIYADNDAIEFDRIMREEFSVRTNILLIGSDATLNNIKSKIEEVLLGIHENDRIYFYFAGHGTCFYSEPRLSCYDSKKDIISEPYSWYCINEIISKVEFLKARGLFFLDACERTVKYSRGANNFSFINDYLTVFSAANSDEKAEAEDEFGHGVWSHFLFNAMTGEEDALKENKLTSTSLQNYLLTTVRDYYIKKRGVCTQTPFMWGKMNDEILIRNFEENKKKIKDKVKISELFFGIVDADNEYKNDKDKFVENFYNLNNVRECVLNSKNIQYVFGKKGTGKTYIGRYLEETNSGNIRYLSFNKLNYKEFHFLAKAGGGYERYIPIWQFVLLSLLIDCVAKQDDNVDIKAILSELFGYKLMISQILNKRFKKAVSIENSKFNSFFVKSNTQFEINEIVDGYKFLMDTCASKKYMLIIDGLDEKIDEHPQYKEMLNALVWSVQEINEYFFENDIQSKLVLFLRKEVFDFVSGSNINKIANGSSVTLNWINGTDDKESYQLYELINNRFKNNLPHSQNINLLDILPKQISTKNGDIYKPWSWILNFTTYKPRDVVSLLSFCAVHSHKNEEKLTENILWNALKDYSDYFYKEFKDELYGFYSQEQIKYLFEAALPQMGNRWVDYLNLSSYISKSEYFRECDIAKLINKLYEVGIIGVQLSHNEHEHWSYRSMVELKEFIKTSKLKLHQGLWKKMSIW